MEQKIKILEKAMTKELLDNKEKGNWDNLHPVYLCSELHYHASKLYKACEEKDKAKILEYSADCGNISMMIADTNDALNSFFTHDVVNIDSDVVADIRNKLGSVTALIDLIKLRKTEHADYAESKMDAQILQAIESIKYIKQL